MQFRAVIYSVDHSINILYLKPKGKWFNFNGRAYRLDSDAVCQVMNKGGRVRGLVECLYIEGNPLPLRSLLEQKKVTEEHLNEKEATVYTRPSVSFWDSIKKLLGR